MTDQVAQAGESGPEGDRPPHPAGRVRGRIRTARLLALAAAIGLVSGAGTGYVVQCVRPPTPLPPLIGARLHAPSGRAAPLLLSAANDDQVRTDGDLRKLLIPTPANSRPWAVPLGSDGWLSLQDYAETYTSPAAEFRWLNSRGFRRIAVTTWLVGTTAYQVELIQFGHNQEDFTAGLVTDQERYETGRAPAPVPGTVNGWAAAGTQPHRDASIGAAIYEGHGMARHGDIVVDAFVDSPQPVGQQTMLDLMTRQLERL